MSSVKTLSKYGVLLAVETTSYGSGTPALSNTTDGFLASDLPEVTPSYQNDGSRAGRVANGFSALRRTNASGRAVGFGLSHYAKGSSVAYSASVFPSPHLILRALGLNAAFSGGAGSEQWLYTMLSTGFTSLVGEIYTKGQKETFKGGYVNSLEISAQGQAVPIWKISGKGISNGLPSDASVPSITYAEGTLMAPKASAISLTMTKSAQTFTAKVAEFNFKVEREMVERENQNASGGEHGGLALGAATATLDVLFETPNMETSSPYINTSAMGVHKLMDTGDYFATELTIGSVQYNKYKISTSYAQIMSVPSDEANGPVAMTRLQMAFMPADDATDLDLNILFN